MRSTNVLKNPNYSSEKKSRNELRSLVWIAMLTCCCAIWMLATLLITLYL